MVAGRKPFVGGNWKSNGTVESVKALCKTLKTSVDMFAKKVDVAVCPIAPHLSLTKKQLKGTNIHTAAQNVSADGEGAFTGEISVGQISDFRISYTLIGHSERRTKYGETDEVTAQKVKMCQEKGVTAIFCIGETLAEREAKKTDAVNERMLKAVLSNVKDWKKMVVAYEPVWAIGTGKVATPDQAQEAHAAIRKMLASSVSQEVADAVRIIYGGSVSGGNCKELSSKPDIDGFLVGGASLKPEFSDIVQSMVPPVPMKKPSFSKVDGIEPGGRGINIVAKVVKTAVPVASSEDVVEVVVGDATGIVTLSLRKDRASVCEKGKSLRIQNAHVAMIKGYIRLSIDKWAVVKLSDEEVTTVKEDKDVSGVEYELKSGKD